MSVFLYSDPTIRHRFLGRDADDRLGWTGCYVRFAWGRFRLPTGTRRDCPECWR